MRIKLKMKALEPISVGYESIGIETLLYSIPIVKDDGTAIEVPIVPGNSLRGVLRDEMAMQFLEDLRAKLAKKNSKKGSSNQLEVHIGTLLSMFSGGILSGEEKGEGAPDITEVMNNYVYPLLPLSIMGVALKKVIIPGKLKVGIGYPLTKETQSLLADLGVDFEKGVPSLSEIQSSVLITRKDDTTKVMQLKELIAKIEGKPEDVKAEDSAIQQRLYRQVVVPGTIFYSYVEDVIPMTDAEWGLVIKTLERLNRVGGRVAGGLGKIKVDIEVIGDKEKYITKYDEFLDNKLNDILNALKTDPNSFFKKDSKSKESAEG
ncbi:MAG: hypothetical protein PWQ79_1986 [Thermococcaceae archaeon]|nr:hypothetical protein [Thermococcaceae archaeon]MDK2915071.1 hypothetical protein [Thermococcaceae archaeon]